MLNYELPKPSPRKAPSEEPAMKRAKTDDAPTTISARIQLDYYSTLQELSKDVDIAVAELIKPLLLKEQTATSNAFGSRSSLTKEDTRFWTETLAFQKLLKGIIAREKYSKSKETSAYPTAAGKWSEDKATLNAIAPKTEDVDAGNLLADGGKVLTLFANASGHKQLFSSFQKPTGIDDKHAFTKRRDSNPSSVQVTTHLRDTGLPNIISSTTIPHLHITDTTKATKARPTIGELFAPPRHLPPLKAPEPSKAVTTKDNTLSFVNREAPRPSGGRHGYNYGDAPLKVGQWLSYGGVDQSTEAASPEQKRKQRDRALSMGSRPGTSRGEPTQSSSPSVSAHLKDEALFRKVYSSFAPAHDDSMALIPEQVKNQIWFRKVGQKRAQQALLIDPAPVDPALMGSSTAETNGHVAEDEETAFAKAVEEYEPANLIDKTKSQAERDTDELLGEISELIETLHSYQLIRNSSLTKPSTPQAQEIVKSFFGTPSTPSDAEYDVYKTLRAQLTLMVASLPPYLLARLDGDRLKDLNVSANILIETSDDRGIMEEDQTAKLAKQASTTATTARHTTATASTPAGAAYSTPQYSRTTAVPPVTTSHSSARPPTMSYGTPQTYFPQNQQPSSAQQSIGGARSNAPLQYQRTASGVQTYVGNYPTQTPRPNYTPQQASYGSGMRPGYGMSGSATGTPSAQPATASQYLARLQQQQAQANSNAAAQAKPNYSSYYAHANANQSVPRPAYSGHSQASQSPALAAPYTQRQGFNPAANPRQAPPSSSASPMIPAANISTTPGAAAIPPQKNSYGQMASGAPTPVAGLPPAPAVDSTSSTL